MERLGKQVFARIVVVAIVVMLAGIAVLGVRAFALLDSKIGPELRVNAEVIGERVSRRIETALSLGIPLDSLAGADDYLERALQSGPGVARLALYDGDGALLHAANASPRGDGAAITGRSLGSLLPGNSSDPADDTLSLPIRHDGAIVADLRVTVDRLFVARQLQNIALDIAVLAAVAILFSAEVLFQIISRTLRRPLVQFGDAAGRVAGGDFRSVTTPIGSRLNAGLIARVNALTERVDAAARAVAGRIAQARTVAAAGGRAISDSSLTSAERALDAAGTFARDGLTTLRATQLMGVRGAAFLFVLAEELTRPFMPLFIQGVTRDLGMDQQAVLIAIPVSAFMAGSALAGPFAAIASDRIGRRNSFVIGALISTLGLLWTAFAGSFEELVLSRALSGLGYALTFVACQGHVIDKTDRQTRTMGMSVFVGGIMAADICGPAIGGILANQIGYAGTLLVAAGTASFAALMAVVLLDNIRPPRTAESRGRGAGLKVMAACSGNLRFVLIVLLTAIPAKMILSGFLFFLVPLLMIDLGANEAEIGRVAMIYGVSAILVMPIFAAMTDRWNAHGFMVGAGALLTGWALVPFLFDSNIWLVALAVAALGLGQSMSIPAQTVLITIVTDRQITRYGPGPVLGVFRLIERIGAALGPLIAAQAVQKVGLAEAGALFGLLSIVTGTLFSALFLTIGTQAAPDKTPHDHPPTREGDTP